MMFVIAGPLAAYAGIPARKIPTAAITESSKQKNRPVGRRTSTITTSKKLKPKKIAQ
jgi:hypothetical protein